MTSPQAPVSWSHSVPWWWRGGDADRRCSRSGLVPQPVLPATPTRILGIRRWKRGWRCPRPRLWRAKGEWTGEAAMSRRTLAADRRRTGGTVPGTILFVLGFAAVFTSYGAALGAAGGEPARSPGGDLASTRRPHHRAWADVCGFPQRRFVGWAHRAAGVPTADRAGRRTDARGIVRGELDTPASVQPWPPCWRCRPASRAQVGQPWRSRTTAWAKASRSCSPPWASGVR